MHIRRVAGVAMVAALGLSLTACGDEEGSGSGSSGGGEKINIGIKYDQPGLGFKDPSGKFTGLDVDVAKYVAKELGFDEGQINFVQSPSKQREKMLAAGTVKMTFATYSITDKRKAEVSFAGPYFVAGQSILVKADSPITGIKDLAGKKVCSVTGSTSVDNLKKQQPALVPQKYDTYSDCASGLADGVVDAMTTDDAILAGFAAQETYKGKFKLAGDTFSVERYGVGLKKGDVETCKKVNTALQKMIDSKAWEKAVKDNLGADYKFNATTNPPKQDACS